jgi:hypothetical protein
MSSLSLPSVDLAESDNYSCKPASLKRVAITLHDLQDRKEQKLVAKESLSDAIHTYTTGLIYPYLIEPVTVI